MPDGRTNPYSDATPAEKSIYRNAIAGIDAGNGCEISVRLTNLPADQPGGNKKM